MNQYNDHLFLRNGHQIKQQWNLFSIQERVADLQNHIFLGGKSGRIVVG